MAAMEWSVGLATHLAPLCRRDFAPHLVETLARGQALRCLGRCLGRRHLLEPPLEPIQFRSIAPFGRARGELLP
jgi:hypothetical protein